MAIYLNLVTDLQYMYVWRLHSVVLIVNGLLEVGLMAEVREVTKRSQPSDSFVISVRLGLKGSDAEKKSHIIVSASELAKARANSSDARSVAAKALIAWLNGKSK